jgi:16S rRNA processing protein RimM
VRKAHGLKGEVSIFLDVDIPELYSDKESFLIRMPEGMVPFFVEAIHIQGSNAIVKFAGIDGPDSPAIVIGKEVYLPLTELPPLTGPKSFYYFEIIGFSLTSPEGRNYGIIEDVQEYGGNIVLAVNPNEQSSEEVLVPMADPLLERVDREKREVVMHVPEGLF